ncbi:alpha-L-rhamnosidase C-terminal domain-containing protein [Streptomyces ipomoeae]|uniref:alpha-L-rhamnosidase C-terminal domain-containing protein n=1 Tax=Streptomyces ipomoeae TaxID=103232 RepID=UPI0029B0D6CF|nr:alpha-L-rhamnosidase C-terminal domain-containing protein [Streptomyces ipomoeae]MDX2825409.1 alpha-L-rhamnosidase C-terminal domain-containing protein [Streptomyces ipomoeae]MDX2877991.1 alpha-L-rhamnosidase C-terminal domain-containing protein [Streptomyces ipomoeae]
MATPYGTASVAWSISDTTLTVNVSLPPGTTGRFSPPKGWTCTTAVGRLGSGEHHLLLRSGS